MISGALGTAIGTGETNTAAVVAACASGVSNSASNLVLNGKNDWFMPSLDELHEIYSALYKASPTLGGFTSANYWSSSDHPTNTGWALQGWFGSSDGIVGWGETDGTNNTLAYRPVRSFTALYTSTVNYGPSTTKPTNAGEYVITPSDLSFTSGAAANYASVVYQTSTITINKAAQSTLSVIALYQPFYGNPTSGLLLTTGGSDTGTVTFELIAGGSAAGCALSGVDS